MPRLSITLTESQAAALDAIAAETGATKQSMIGLAVSAWIRANDHLTADSVPTPEIASQALLDEEWADEEEHEITVTRSGVEVGWFRGRLVHDMGGKLRIEFTAHRIRKDGDWHELDGRIGCYELTPLDSTVYV